MTKKRAYCFTLNNYTDEECALIAIMCEELPVRYLVCGFEVGEQGTPHLQGYVYMENAVQITYFKDFMPRAHFIESKGDPEQNYMYCTKESDAFVYGEMPVKGRATWDKIVDAMKDPRSNPHLYNQYHKAYKRIVNNDPIDVEKERRLIKFDFIEEAYELMAEQPTDKNFYDSIALFDVFDGERICIMNIFEYTERKHLLSLWEHKLSPKIRRGYELIKFDPDMVFVIKNYIVE